MKEKAPGAWITLSTSYYPAIVVNPLCLLDDAYTLLERAHSVVHLVHEVLQSNPRTDKQTLTTALRAVETLMEMSAGSTEAAHVRFEEMGDVWAPGKTIDT